MLFYENFPRLNVDLPIYGNREDCCPDPNKKIVVCLGCSNTYGEVPNEETWPTQLWKEIGTDYQVLNMGRCNYGLKLNIDWYFYFVKYQIHSCIIQLPQFFRQPHPSLQRQIQKNYTLFEGSLKVRKEIGDFKWLCSVEKMIDLEIKRLNDFIDDLSQQDIAVSVLAYKSCRYFTSDATDLYHEEVESLCKQKLVKCYIGNDLTSSYFDTKGWVLDRSHPNLNGNIYIANKVKSFFA